MKKIYVILNPNAKKFRTNKSSIDNYTSIKYEGLKIFFSGNSDELHGITRQVIAEKPDYICIGGGDGTIHIVLTELIIKYRPNHIPPVLILKEGTMDNIARTIHLEGRGDKILGRLVSAVKKEEDVQVFRRDTIEIDGKYCFLFGIGFVTNFLRLAYNGHEKGALRNTYVGAKTFIEALLNTTDGEVFTNMDISIMADGKSLDINHITGILSGTVEHIGMGFSPLIEASAVPGKFQTIVFGMEPRQVLFNLSKIKHGDKIFVEGYNNFHSGSLKLNYNGSFDYTMDGDLYRADDELMIKAGPEIELVKI